MMTGHEMTGVIGDLVTKAVEAAPGETSQVQAAIRRSGSDIAIWERGYWLTPLMMVVPSEMNT